MSPFRVWLLMSAAALLAVAFTTRSDATSLIVVGLGCVAAGLALFWHHTRGAGQKLRALRAHWMNLPGATVTSGRIHVHDRMQPLLISTRWQRGAPSVSIYTPVPTAAFAFRVWPTGQSTPPIDRTGNEFAGPPVEPALELESTFAGKFRAEASDGRAAARIFDGDLRRILYEILGEVPLEFGGFTFDGQALGVHFTGTTAMDPGRATRLARTAWSALVPE